MRTYRNLILIVTIITINLHFTSCSQNRINSMEKHKYWINTSTNIRHNHLCKRYGNTNEGYYTVKVDGRACKICGG
jgi:hypothetical protein